MGRAWTAGALATIVLTALVASCSSSSSSPPATSGIGGTGAANSTATPGGTDSVEPVTTADPAAALALLGGDLADIEGELDDAGVIAAAGQVLQQGAADPALLFAAAYVWANTGDDPSLLLPLLSNADPSTVLTAAIGLVAQGRSEGFAPLIAALTSDEVLVRYGTGEPAWSAVSLALARFTGVAENGPPFDANLDQRVLAQSRWQQWLDTNGASMTFDATQELWSTT
jgi:hypothetical protein